MFQFPPLHLPKWLPEHLFSGSYKPTPTSSLELHVIWSPKKHREALVQKVDKRWDLQFSDPFPSIACVERHWFHCFVFKNVRACERPMFSWLMLYNYSTTDTEIFIVCFLFAEKVSWIWWHKNSVLYCKLIQLEKAFWTRKDILVQTISKERSLIIFKEFKPNYWLS